MSEIYFVRHGQASFGSEDYDRLSPLGVRQAQVGLGERLAVAVVDVGHEATGVVVTEVYDPAVSFVEAVPPPDTGTTNQWTIGDLTGGLKIPGLT